MTLDPVSRMFSWWNEAYKTPGAYTEEAFRIYFTDDAELIIDGRLVTRGVGGWAKHFQAIQAGGGEVEIVVPFKEVFRVENKVYTYHPYPREPRWRGHADAGCRSCDPA